MEARIRFPHFKPIETEVAKKLIKERAITGIWKWDVHLETPQSRRMRESGDSLQMSEAPLYDMRIDGVCEAATEIWIVEIDNRLRPSAIGKLRTYMRLYKEQYAPMKPIRLLVAASEDNEVMHNVLYAEGIRWWITPK